ncbi:hypothetical protein K2173_014192 [Erythroxylum novogranatense]|uniref:Amino acid transporter transmembrane domain-containing protein n=1 Tax=Erythroxylum novogranatense TaxID=1862640 RepID=A0AAV8SDI9_9ROSI|nr:hypothetical protein K2173_014192 [Erythroxylum novogranatense]
MMNRAVHAAARGGNLIILKELLDSSSDVLAYIDKHDSTILHAAAASGQVERPITRCWRNFPHMAVSGFHSPAFRRLDRQIELMKQLLCGKAFSLEDIINVRNNKGRTALDMAIVGNVHSEFVQLLMSAQSLNVNIRDADDMTQLDLLRQRPQSASSDILIRQLISAGGIFSCQDYSARRAIASRLKMQGNGRSPGTSFRISDTEIFLYTGIEIISDASAGPASAGMSSTDLSRHESANENQTSTINKKQSSVNHAAQRLKRALQWARMKGQKAERFKKSGGREASNAALVLQKGEGSATMVTQVQKPEEHDDQSSIDEKQKQIDGWLPITSSRNAKWWYSAFHNVTAMVGAGILSLPYAMSNLGWYVLKSNKSVCDSVIIRTSV